MTNKPTLAIVTEGLRRDNQKPLRYFYKINITHLYESAPYGNETKEDLKGAVKFDGAKELYQKLINLKPDIIQGPEPYGSRKMFLYSMASYKAAKKLRVPLIFPFWENRPPEKRFNFFQKYIVNWFLKRYMAYASLVIYINNGALANIKKVGIRDKSKLIKFLWGTWGVDIDEFKPSVDPLKDKIKQHTILYIGRLVEEKGIKYLLEAFKKVVSRFSNTQLLLIGSGDLENYIKKFRDENNLTQKIILKGQVKNKDIPQYYQNATIFCSPSITISWWAEQVGMTNIQAMACGVPIVSTTSGGIPEYVPNKVAGFLVREKDADRLASALVRLLEDKDLRTKISRQAVQYARTHYDAQKNIHRAQTIILDLLNNEKHQK